MKTNVPLGVSMTKEQWLEACDRNFHAAKQAFVLQLQAMRKSNFLALAERYWEEARAVYGPECDLMTRNLLQEAEKEAHDGVEYRVGQLVKIERGLR